MTEDTGKIGWIYMIQEREFIRLSENVFKVGFTCAGVHRRCAKYPKGSVLYFAQMVSIPVVTEASILQAMDRMFSRRSDIGREYFQGDRDAMMQLLGRMSCSFPVGDLQVDDMDHSIEGESSDATAAVANTSEAATTDMTTLLITFVNQRITTLSGQNIPLIDLAADFTKYAEESIKLKKPLQLTWLDNKLKKFFNASTHASNGVPTVCFPLTKAPAVNEETTLEKFVGKRLTRVQDAQCTLKEIREAAALEGLDLGSKWKPMLETLLQTKCIAQKKHDAQKHVNVFVGWQLHPCDQDHQDIPIVAVLRFLESVCFQQERADVTAQQYTAKSMYQQFISFGHQEQKHMTGCSFGRKMTRCIEQSNGGVTKDKYGNNRYTLHTSRLKDFLRRNGLMSETTRLIEAAP